MPYVSCLMPDVVHIMHTEDKSPHGIWADPGSECTTQFCVPIHNPITLSIRAFTHRITSYHLQRCSINTCLAASV